MVTLMYKNTNTQNKNSAKQKQNKQTNNQTNKLPPPKKKQKNISCFDWICYRMQRFHSDLFIWREKEGDLTQ